MSKKNSSSKKTGYDIPRLFHILDDVMQRETVNFHEPRDNSKLKGIPAWNLLPVCTCSPEARRTCAVDGCYAVKNACCHGYDVNKNYCLNAWTENTVLAKRYPRTCERLLDRWLTDHKPTLFRIHSSGDFFDVKYARMWKRLARKHPETRFLAFTKQFEVVRHVRFWQVVNFELVLSGWTGINIPDDLRKHYRCAWCNDGTETRIPANAIHCPGDCNHCRACWYLSRMGKDSFFDKH